MRWYVVTLVGTLVAAGLGLFLIVKNTTPTTSSTLIHALFFVTLFLTVASILALIVLAIVHRIKKHL